MITRRKILTSALSLSAAVVAPGLVTGCSVGSPSVRRSGPSEFALLDAKPAPLPKPARQKEDPMPDLFDARNLDIDFWVKPRVLDITRPASKERAKVLYWEDGEIKEDAYQKLCHLLRDVNGKASHQIDPKLFELLWSAQAFVKQFGIDSPLEILSGYRTPASNKRLQEQGIPAARKSLHMEGKAADIRIPHLDAGVLGGLVRSFQKGGVGFYYRPTANGGWIHADTGLQRTWKG